MMKRLLLRIIRWYDDTAFICVSCNKINRGIGARIGRGWACRKECFDIEFDKMLGGYKP